MPQYKLTYFNLRGRGEVMRLMFAYAGVDYVDDRIEFQSEHWAQVKASMPFAQIPVLSIDDTKICQSNAGARYLAKQFGLYGSNDVEAAQIDMIVDCMEDVIKPLLRIVFNQNEAEKAQLKKKYEEEELPDFLTRLQNILTSNGKGEYFVGDKLSLADFHFAHMITFPNGKVEFSLNKYPKLAALKTRVENLPKVKDWIAKRPESFI